ncbi:MAG: sulfurtransferase TusA family protein [Candidatus Aramenus sp.]|jgi:TusA-related sulfurtransferase|nr:sulfurtransferase TusA family protein [Candidatus Aramenus sp.]
MTIEDKLRNSKPAKVLDLRGEACPEPQIEVVKALNQLKSGEVLEVISDEEPLDSSIQNICKSRGYPCTSIKRGENEFIVRILKE